MKVIDINFMLIIKGKKNYVWGTGHTQRLPASAPGYKGFKLYIKVLFSSKKSFICKIFFLAKIHTND